MLPPQGCKFRRTPYDNLREKHGLTTASLIAEYRLIMAKTSHFSAGERQAVAALIESAAVDMINEYKRAKQPQK